MKYVFEDTIGRGDFVRDGGDTIINTPDKMPPHYERDELTK